MKPSENIVEEHGFFWWANESIPDDQFAPDAAVSGTLQIGEDGVARLELHGTLPHPHGPMAPLIEAGRPLPAEKIIFGKLKSSNRTVLLLEVRHSGGSFRSGGISFESYTALQALLGAGVLRTKDRLLEFARLEVELKGFEEWLWLNAIEAKQTRASVQVRYRRPRRVTYRLPEARLSMIYDVAADSLPFRSMSLTQLGRIEYAPKRAIPLADMKAQYGLLCDLFILMTGADFNLEWPVLTLNGVSGSAWQYIFARNHSRAAPPKAHECWVPFSQVQDHFGKLFVRFRERRKNLGPGIYLYLGSRRAAQMYEEHRFVNLVWGIESLHRRNAGSAPVMAKLQAKIQRILSQVTREADRTWLEVQLRHAGEPSLAQRMFSTLELLPLGLEVSRLRAFCDACAKRRNDISHFGGNRQLGDVEDYRNFIRDLGQKSEALSYLYHVLLLQEIGVDSELLKRRVFNGARSYQCRSALVEAGLLTEAVLKER